MLVTPAYAQAAAGGPAGLLQGLAPMILILGIMYLLIIRPQQKKVKAHQAMVAALRRGDQVVTQGGIIGKVTRVKDEDTELEVAAQMSQESRELARLFNDEKVARARHSIAARREEADRMETKITEAHAISAELRHLLDDVEMEEDMVRSRLRRLREELSDILPRIDEPRETATAPERRRARIEVVPGE